MSPDSIFAKIPPEIRREGLKTETLIRAESRLMPPPGVEEDLFAGIE